MYIEYPEKGFNGVSYLGKLVPGAVGLGAVESEERDYGALGHNERWLDGGIHLDRVNSEHYTLLMYIIYRNHNLFKPTSEVVLLNDVNCRFISLVE